ncbi:MAG TPA: hypothetical protein VKD00_07050 [Methyloceanibacter sp.]|nr:hypothetical protein [Methyloceanibacter sp.]
MTLFGLIVAICIILLVLWIVKMYMPQPWQTPTLVIVVLLGILFLLAQLWPAAANMKVR